MTRRRIALLVLVLAACKAAPEDNPTLPPSLLRGQRAAAACAEVNGHQKWADCFHRLSYPAIYTVKK